MKAPRKLNYRHTSLVSHVPGKLMSFGFQDTVDITAIKAVGEVEKLKVKSIRMANIEYLYFDELPLSSVIKSRIHLPNHLYPNQPFTITLEGEGNVNVWLEYINA